MAKNKDVFGFDELEKAFKKMEKKYPNQADAMLMAQGQAVNKKTKQLTPVYTGTQLDGKYPKKPRQLKKSWRLKKVKLYKGGTVRVVRVQSTAPHAHLVEDGHEIVRGGRTRVKGKKLNRIQRAVRGIKSGGRVNGKQMLRQSISEAQQRFNRDAEKLLDKLTEDVEV